MAGHRDQPLAKMPEASKRLGVKVAGG